ncbi:MAG TPA: hypothetical protein DEP42_06260 [Ruminococcaceae bacterium]|nr:hypothetical protein [Oscillospiraceae bacterium]
MNEKLNVWQKLSLARDKLQTLNLKKSGHNEYTKFYYFELSDFLPSIIKILKELSMVSLVSFTTEVASLTIINTENTNEKIVFTSPMSSSNLKGCHEVQNLGSTETYERRYLYMMAFEIVESDALDATLGKEKQGIPAAPPKAKKVVKPSPKARVYNALVKKFGKEKAEPMLYTVSGYKSPKDIPDEKCEEIIKTIAIWEEPSKENKGHSAEHKDFIEIAE